MNDAYGILVIILSVALAVFLILASIIAVQVLRLIRILKTIAEKADNVVTSAEAVGQAFKRVSGPASIVALLKTVLDSVAEHKRNK